MLLSRRTNHHHVLCLAQDSQKICENITGSLHVHRVGRFPKNCAHIHFLVRKPIRLCMHLYCVSVGCSENM